MNPNLSRLALMVLCSVVLPISGGRDALAQFILGTPTNLGPPVNTSANQFLPDVSADGLSLFYTTGTVGENPDLFVAKRDSMDGAWKDPQRLGPSINTPYDEWSPAISPDGQELYFADNTFPDLTSRLRPGGIGRGDIWVSLWNEESGSWDEPSVLKEPVNSTYIDSGPNFSHDGLELYFSSTRPGGSGGEDIWVARRDTVEAPWGEPVNLGPQINSSSHDEEPAISPDGRTLFFGSKQGGGIRRRLYVSTREHPGDAWGPRVDASKLNTGSFNLGADISSDGSAVYFHQCCDGDLYQASILPLEKVSLAGGGATYLQDFDQTLSSDGTKGATLPTGWAVTDNGLIFEDTTTRDFPATAIASGFFNAGQEQDVDRALAIGLRRSDAPVVQFLAESGDSDAAAFQFQFDVEAWDAVFATTPGEAAFDVTVELDTGEGFSTLADLGRVTTGPNLFPPAGEILDGNSDMNRVAFDSGVINADIPTRSQLRFRWAAAADAQTTGWVFGLDNVRLTLFEDVASPGLLAGDADQDLDFDQLDLVQVQIAGKYLTGQAATWGEGDWNGAPGGQQGNPPAGDGLFNQLDIVAAQQTAAYLTGPYSALAPGGQTGDGQTSVVYNPGTGELAVDAPAGIELTSINIDSASGIFSGVAAENLGGSFDNDADNNIFKATFGSSFGSLSFGNVAQAGLSQEFVLNDLAVVGSLAGGGALGNVDLVYVPEPTAAVLVLCGVIGLGLFRRRA